MFAFTGLVLAGIGLYGLISFLVAERTLENTGCARGKALCFHCCPCPVAGQRNTREIGVRIALGATPGQVARLVVSDGVRWTAAGALAGIAASGILLRLLQGLLYQVKVLDLRVFAGAVTVLVVVAIVAAWLPAYRASRTDPMIALRHD